MAVDLNPTEQAEVSPGETPLAGLSEGESRVIATFVQLAQALGVQRSLGEMYGLLFATPHPMAFQEFVDRLHLSKGTVSQGLRFLRTIGAVQPVVVPGDRREFFEPVIELRQLVSGFLRERLNPEIDTWGARIKGLTVKDFDQGHYTNEQRDVIDVRIDKLQTWQKRAHLVLPLIGRMLG